MFEAKIDKLM